MDVQQAIVTLVIGGVAGWLAGLIMKGGGFGVVGNILVGIVGAVVGGFVLGSLGVSLGGGLAGALVNAVIGAVLVLFVIGLIKK